MVWDAFTDDDVDDTVDEGTSKDNAVPISDDEESLSLSELEDEDVGEISGEGGDCPEA